MKPTRIPSILSTFVAVLFFSATGMAAEKGVAKKSPPKLQELTLKIENLTPKTKKAESKKLEKAVKKVKGVKVVIVRKKKSELFTKYMPETDVAAIRKAVADAGFKIAGADDEEAPADNEVPPAEDEDYE